MENNRAIPPSYGNEDISFDIYELHIDGDPHAKFRCHVERENLEILWLQVGSGIHIVDGVEFPFDNNTIFCGTPEQLDLLKERTDFVGYVISFTESFLRQGTDGEYGLYCSEFVALFTQLPALQLQQYIADEINHIAARMIQESSRDHLLKSILLRRYLKIILIYALRYSSTERSVTPHQTKGLMIKLMSEVNKQFHIKKLVTKYASALSISTKYLKQVVMKVTGDSAGYYIRKPSCYSLNA